MGITVFLCSCLLDTASWILIYARLACHLQLARPAPAVRAVAAGGVCRAACARPAVPTSPARRWRDAGSAGNRPTAAQHPATARRGWPSRPRRASRGTGADSAQRAGGQDPLAGQSAHNWRNAADLGRRIVLASCFFAAAQSDPDLHLFPTWLLHWLASLSGGVSRPDYRLCLA